MKQIKFFSLALSSLISATAWSGTAGPLPVEKSWTWAASVSGGFAVARAGETETFFLAPGIEKSYVAQKDNNTLATGEVFFGVHKWLQGQSAMQLGLALSTTGNADLQGVIWDDASPLFDNHKYQYKIRNTRIALKGKFIFDNIWMVNPWVSATAGVGFNRAHSFDNQPVIFQALPNNNFENNTKTAFSYGFGAGVQKNINQHWHVGVGYEFSDWGKSQLDRARGQTLGTGLSLNHLYTNGATITLGYVA